MAKANKTEESFDSIADLVSSINQGNNSLIEKLEDDKVEWQTTNLVGLDNLLGGGRPKGRIIEIFGPESSGKTALSLQMIGTTCRLGGRGMLVDAEYAYDKNWSKKFGIPVEDNDKFIVVHPDYGEQGLEVVVKTVKSGLVDIIVVDSVSALTPKEELDADVGKQQMGLQARMMSKALRKLTAIVSKSNCTVIFINQLRTKIGVMFGNPEVTSGGKALKFYSSIRLDVRRKEWLGGKESPIGIKQKIKTVKNKMAPPFREIMMDFSFKNGYPVHKDILDQALQFGVIVRGGGWYRTECEFLEEQLKLKKKDMLDKIKKSGKLRKALKKEIKACYNNQSTGEDEDEE